MKNLRLQLDYLKAAVTLAALGLINSSCSDNFSRSERPNIIFIYVDDLGWADLGCYGNTYHETPNIDKLARQGMIYTDAYAPAPVCSPARAGVFSGQYPARIGLTDWIPGHWRPFERKLAVINRTQYLPLEVQTIGEAMQTAGYKTGYFGKWHLGYKEKYAVENQGFEEVVRFNNGGTYYHLNTRLTPLQPQLADSAYLTDVLTDFGIEFLKANQDSPFFLVLSHFAVHLPLDVPDSILNPFLKKPQTEEVNNPWYAAMLKSLDNNVGRLLKSLEEEDLTQNTVVVLYSDNGGLYEPYRKEFLKYTRNQPVTSNAPLRGEKGNLYEGGIRVPLVIRWPEKIKEGSTSNSIINGMDFYPTFLELAGAEHDDMILDGESITRTFSSPQSLKNRKTFWHYPVYHHDTPASALRSGDYKLIHHYLSDSYELYDLKNDLSESRDLGMQNPQLRDSLAEILNVHLEDVNAQLPIENPNFDPNKRLEWGPHPDRK